MVPVQRSMLIHVACASRSTNSLYVKQSVEHSGCHQPAAFPPQRSAQESVGKEPQCVYVKNRGKRQWGRALHTLDDCHPVTGTHVWMWGARSRNFMYAFRVCVCRCWCCWRPSFVSCHVTTAASSTRSCRATAWSEGCGRGVLQSL